MASDSKKGDSETSSSKEEKTIETLVDNFTSFQKVMTNLTEKFDNLSNQMSELLKLFESSAKALAEKDYKKEKEEKTSKEELRKKKEIVEKLDKVLEQNKTIAKGLTLMHEKVEEHEDALEDMGGGQGPQPGSHISQTQGFQGMQPSSMRQPPQQPQPQRPPQQQPPQQPSPNPQAQQGGQQPAQPSSPPQQQEEETTRKISPNEGDGGADFQKHFPKGPSTHPEDDETSGNEQSNQNSSEKKPIHERLKSQNKGMGQYTRSS